MAAEIKISEKLSIQDWELSFTFSRSGGPGGQNVNKINSRVTLWFDVLNSPSLSKYQKSVISKKLSTRINKDGILRVVSMKHRTQLMNRNAAVENFREIMFTALKKEARRIPTKISRSANEKRLTSKKKRSWKKKNRKIDDIDFS